VLTVTDEVPRVPLAVPDAIEFTQLLGVNRLTVRSDKLRTCEDTLPDRWKQLEMVAGLIWRSYFQQYVMLHLWPLIPTGVVGRDLDCDFRKRCSKLIKNFCQDKAGEVVRRTNLQFAFWFFLIRHENLGRLLMCMQHILTSKQICGADAGEVQSVPIATNQSRFRYLLDTLQGSAHCVERQVQ